MNRRELLKYLPFGLLASVPSTSFATKYIASRSLDCAGQAVPFYRASALVATGLAHHWLPQAQAFARTADALGEALSPSAPQAATVRQRWVECMLAWEGLAAVPAGAVLERRAVRTLDFWPTRPPQLLALMQLAHTADKAALGAAVRAAGAAVKGLPALEWLLWRQWDAPGARTLAAQLASELSLEAGALLQDYSEGKRNAEAEDPDEAKAWTDYGEWFGQCMGSMEQLRLKKMRTNTRGKDTAVWVRGVSKQTSAAWQAHWGGIAQFLSTINAHGCGDARANTYRFTTLLRSRGHLEAATRLEEQMAATARAVHAARPEDAISVQRAQNALAALQARASDMGSRYFDFSQGFTDADGD